MGHFSFVAFGLISVSQTDQVWYEGAIVFQGSRVVLELLPDSHIDLSDTGVWAIQMQQQQGQVKEDYENFAVTLFTYHVSHF